jgi:3-deoxy-manno-octulosonate cytidylyltransferase (CMP-KDO synthetase)
MDLKQDQTQIVAVIPARMGSSRFPGKPLKPILGMPMIGHVYHRVSMAKTLSSTYVATCDPEIFDYITGMGGQAIMTRTSHERCTDRCAEALEKIEASGSSPVDILVMVQGDEPMVHPEMIDEAVLPMVQDPKIQVANLLGEITSSQEFEDPNTIKVVVDKESNALYFSRATIPSQSKFQGECPLFKQVCIIPFRRDFLLDYLRMEPTQLEIVESVDMMRILEWGGKVRMVPTRHNTQAVDTERDLLRVEDLMRKDELTQAYLQENQGS